MDNQTDSLQDICEHYFMPPTVIAVEDGVTKKVVAVVACKNCGLIKRHVVYL